MGIFPKGSWIAAAVEGALSAGSKLLEVCVVLYEVM